MSFPPNIKPEDARKLGKERGKKHFDPEDNWPKDDHPRKKTPWLERTPVNKSKKYKKKLKDVADLLSAEYSGDHGESDDHVKRMKEMTHKLGEYTHKACDAEPYEEDGVHMEKDCSKALSTRSMHIPRPHSYYDPHDIMRSATTPNTRGHSRLQGPSGVAPLVGETLHDAEDSAAVRSKQVTYKSCNFHQLVHRSDTGCGMCNHSVSKSLSCDKCGSDMYKYKGGSLSCKDCG